MTYSQQDIQTIEELASIFLSISDIAELLDVPADILREDISDRNSEPGRAYRKGKLQAKIKLRRQEMQFASAGSPVAIENTAKYLEQMEIDE